MKKLSNALKPMMNQNNWVTWKYTLDGKKPPFQSGRPRAYASPTNPETWSSYRKREAEAVQAL
jgi:primase-polymerase (primpol)-like protein